MYLVRSAQRRYIYTHGINNINRETYDRGASVQASVTIWELAE